MEICNCKIKFTLIILTLFLTVNTYGIEFFKSGEQIVIDLCDISPNSNFYEWKILHKPDNSTLNDDDINIDSCSTAFTPDLSGTYEIEFNSDNYNEIFKYVVLETLEKSKLDITYTIANEYYYNNLEYYTDYENNELEFSLDKKIKKINFNVKGFAVAEDLETYEIFIINTNNDYYLKYDYLYKINFYPDSYKPLEVIVNTADMSNIDFVPFEKNIEISVVNSENKNINSIVTIYSEDNTVSKYLNGFNKNVYVDNADELLISPVKKQNNYPSFIINHSMLENAGSSLRFEYDNIKFNDLRISLGGIKQNEFVTVKVKSLLLYKCLADLPVADCFYQKSLILDRSTEISLPNGKYEITVFKKGSENIVKTIDFQGNQEVMINNFQDKNTVDIAFPQDIIAVSFDDTENNNYYFVTDGSFDKINLPAGVYNIELFTEYGIYNIKSLSINDDTDIDYKWSEINIKIKENNKIKYGGIVIINNKNYVFNNGNSVKFYIEK